jgi:hypothetical protein
MNDVQPQQWRDLTDLRAEHVAMLELLEGKLLAQGMPPEQVRVSLLEQANIFREYELGDLVMPQVPKPTGAGHWSPWRFREGDKYVRDFEGRNRTLHGIEIQIVGSQEVNENGDVSTTRKLRISGQAVLTAQEAGAVASAIWGDTETMQTLDREDNVE